MAHYTIETDYSGRVTGIREDDYSDVSLGSPFLSKLSLIIYYFIGLVGLVTMMVSMIVSKIFLWTIVAAITLIYLFTPILYFKFPSKKAKSIGKLLLHSTYTVLISVEMYLCYKLGQTPVTISILAICMYGIYYIPYLFINECRNKSIFSLIFTWIAIPVSIAVFLINSDGFNGMAPIILPFTLTCFYVLHSIVKIILKRYKKYGNNDYFGKAFKIVNYTFVGIFAAAFLGFLIWAATLTA